MISAQLLCHDRDVLLYAKDDPEDGLLSLFGEGNESGLYRHFHKYSEARPLAEKALNPMRKTAQHFQAHFRFVIDVTVITIWSAARHFHQDFKFATC